VRRAEYLLPPYLHLLPLPLVAVDAGEMGPGMGALLGQGAILLLTLDMTCVAAPSYVCSLQQRLPWLPTVVVVEPSHDIAGLIALVHGLAREDLRVVVDGPSRREAAVGAAQVPLDPEKDLRPWLRKAVPLWPAAGREYATGCFSTAFAYDPETRPEGGPRPRRQPLWVQVGRATRAALSLQSSPHLPLARVADDAGYSDYHAMNRALRRAFGVSSQVIRGTIGWEWLLWRFITGQGEGKLKRWDQYPKC